MVNLPTVAAGAAIGAVVSDAYDKAKDRAAGAAGTPTVDHGPVELHMLVDMVSRIEEAIHAARAAVCPPEFKVELIPGNGGAVVVDGLRYERRGYKHVSLLAAATFTLVVQSPIGPINFTMNAGWNACDFPDHVTLWNTSANPIKVVLYRGDDTIDITGV